MSQEHLMDVRSLIPDNGPIALSTRPQRDRLDGLPVVATQDHELIRQWAVRRRAEPATGEATESGPSTTTVNDDGTGIRFNFPGVGRFRPIEWDEWFRNFDAYSLVFVYERDDAEPLAEQPVSHGADGRAETRGRPADQSSASCILTRCVQLLVSAPCSVSPAAGLAFQAVINTRLSAALGSPLWARVVQVFVGLAFLVACVWRRPGADAVVRRRGRLALVGLDRRCHRRRRTCHA